MLGQLQVALDALVEAWLKLEMSRRTWYRRQAEKRKGRE
jgi:hypothetical protein